MKSSNSVANLVFLPNVLFSLYRTHPDFAEATTISPVSELARLMVLIPKLTTEHAAKAVKSLSQLLNLLTQIQFNTVLLACFSKRFSDIMLDAMLRLLRSDYVPSQYLLTLQ